MLSIISAISNLSYGAAITFDPPTTPLSPGTPITSWTESEFIVSGSEFFLHTDSATLDNFYPDNGTAYIRTTFNRPQLTVSNLNVADLVPINQVAVGADEIALTLDPPV